MVTNLHIHGENTAKKSPKVLQASLAYKNIVRISRDYYETILVGKFPSREIGEKCASRRSRISNTAESN